ncbi:MAG: HAD-IA family hydrolase [Muribaculaceae bacterium]|nr:HAD-IA family hydrolase [Muribaculaceae bacterium]
MYENEIQHFLKRHGYICVEPKAALVDMDGTLYDSMPRHADAWVTMMAEQGITVARDEFFRFEGRTGASTINILFNRAFGRDATPEEVERLYRRKSELFAAMPQEGPMPGALDMLAFLRSIGVECVLVTGSGQRTLIDRIGRDFPGVFAPDAMITSRDVKHGKPDPEPYFKGMELVGKRPDECIVVENAPLGVQAGDAAGAFTIGVSTGPIPASELYDAGAAIVFSSMPELSAAIPALIYGLLTTRRNLN